MPARVRRGQRKLTLEVTDLGLIAHTDKCESAGDVAFLCFGFDL